VKKARTQYGRARSSGREVNQIVDSFILSIGDGEEVAETGIPQKQLAISTCLMLTPLENELQYFQVSGI
jgi:hypothetical protein